MRPCKRSPTIEVCITVKRTEHEVFMENDRDFWYHDLMSMPIASPKCETEEMDAEDMLFILYTSGTTGRPKGLVAYTWRICGLYINNSSYGV